MIELHTTYLTHFYWLKFHIHKRIWIGRFTYTKTDKRVEKKTKLMITHTLIFLETRGNNNK